MSANNNQNQSAQPIRSSSRSKKLVERYQGTLLAPKVSPQLTPGEGKASGGSQAASQSTTQIIQTGPGSGKASGSSRGKSNAQTQQQTQQQPTASTVRKRNKRRVAKARITADLIRNLPDGITYSPDGEDPAQSNKKKEGKYQNIVKVGDFIFDIEVVSKPSLISMRKYLPSEEYRLLKNRKSARICRLKRKEERGSMKNTLTEVEVEMAELRADVASLKEQLSRSERKRMQLKSDLDVALRNQQALLNTKIASKDADFQQSRNDQSSSELKVPLSKSRKDHSSSMDQSIKNTSKSPPSQSDRITSSLSSTSQQLQLRQQQLQLLQAITNAPQTDLTPLDSSTSHQQPHHQAGPDTVKNIGLRLQDLQNNTPQLVNEPSLKSSTPQNLQQWFVDLSPYNRARLAQQHALTSRSPRIQSVLGKSPRNQNSAQKMMPAPKFNYIVINQSAQANHDLQSKIQLGGTSATNPVFINSGFDTTMGHTQLQQPTLSSTSFQPQIITTGGKRNISGETPRNNNAANAGFLTPTVINKQDGSHQNHFLSHMLPSSVEVTPTSYLLSGGQQQQPKKHNSFFDECLRLNAGNVMQQQQRQNLTYNY